MSHPRRWIPLLCALALSASACIFEDGTSPVVTPVPCATDLPGPALIPAIVPTSLTPYCVDATEVTQAHYAAFLADTGGIPPEGLDRCDWNEDLTPKSGQGGCPAGTYDPETRGELPVTCVDWCDAQAYCSWAGKRLCGQIGGGTYTSAGYNAWDTRISQWYNACSDVGRVIFPYGDRYEPARCNGAEAEIGGLWPAGSSEACVGIVPPLEEIYDMSGNAAEWEDLCDPSDEGNGRDICFVRGGAYNVPNDYETSPDNDNALACLGFIKGYERRVGDMDWVGFRCCAD